MIKVIIPKIIILRFILSYIFVPANVFEVDYTLDISQNDIFISEIEKFDDDIYKEIILNILDFDDTNLRVGCIKEG